MTVLDIQGYTATQKSAEERLALLEYKDELKGKTLEAMDHKLDELLALRQKGMGAFWVASSILGTGIIGAIALVVQWLKGY